MKKVICESEIFFKERENSLKDLVYFSELHSLVFGRHFYFEI